MIRHNRRSACLFLVYILGLNLRVCSSEEELPCQLSILIPFHDDRIIAAGNSSTVISSEDNLRDGLTLLASALLAIHDFNNRESLVAPDALQGIQDACTIHFPPPIITDSRRSAAVIQSAVSSWLPAENSTCSFVIGPNDNLVAEVVGQTVNANGTLAISYGADADELANDSLSYPNLALGSIKWEDYVRSLLQYVKTSGREDVGVLLTPEDNLDFNNTDFVPMWTSASQDSGVEIKSLSRISSRSKNLFEERLLTLRDERGAKTILVTLHRDDELAVLAEVADSLGMLTDEYTWIMTEHFLSSRYVESYSVPITSYRGPTSPIAKLFERTEIFEILDGFSPFAENKVNASELLRTDLLSQSAMLVERIQAVVSRTAALQGIVVNQTVLEEAFFLNAPANGASMLYDTIFASGLSACSGEVDMGNLLGTEFYGVSGRFAYRKDLRSLSASETQFGVFSISPSADADSAQIYGRIVGCLGMLVSIACGVFVYKFRKDRIIAVGQPEFLGLVCCGAFLVAIPAILRSFDEGSGWSSLYLSVSCTFQIWLKYLGILIVNMALFSKLYRVEKVTQMRRRQRIQVKDVIKPFCGLFGAAFVLLIVWTAVDKPVWKREFEIGFCYEAIYFGVAMDIVMIIAISLTLWWGHKTRDLPEDISDSSRVYYTLVAQFVLLMLDILFSVFTRAIEDNTFAFVVEATFSFALSLTCVVYLIVPKMYNLYRKSRTGELPPSLQHGTVTVTGIQVPTGAQGISGARRYDSQRYPPSLRASSNRRTSASAASGFLTSSSDRPSVHMSDPGTEHKPERMFSDPGTQRPSIRSVSLFSDPGTETPAESAPESTGSSQAQSPSLPSNARDMTSLREITSAGIESDTDPRPT